MFRKQKVNPVSPSLDAMLRGAEIRSLHQILPEARDKESIANCRTLLHRTDPLSARSIVKEEQITGKNSAVSFSIAPAQICQSEKRGSILVFDWKGPIDMDGDPKVDRLLHVLAANGEESKINYVESLIHRPSTKGQLLLIGIIEPDIVTVADASSDFGCRNGICEKVQMLASPLSISVV